MSFDITIKGDEAFEREVRKIKKKSPDQLDKMLARMAFDTNKTAIESMQKSPKSGRAYNRGSISHTASSAGNPPAIDTGNLARNVTVDRISKASYTTGSRKGGFYGRFLEFGTRTIAARPWLAPAYDKTISKFNAYKERYLKND